jgi:hypothetical protein
VPRSCYQKIGVTAGVNLDENARHLDARGVGPAIGDVKGPRKGDGTNTSTDWDAFDSELVVIYMIEVTNNGQRVYNNDSCSRGARQCYCHLQLV